MYSKQEASKLKQAFWTAFGQYMQPIQSAEGEKINWINYKTGVPNIYFKMDADNTKASINIVFAHKDLEEQEAKFEQMVQLKAMLYNALGEDWQWQPMVQDEFGKTISQVGKEITGVSVFRNADWPTLISFFKQRIIALDEFWSNAKYGFEL